MKKVLAMALLGILLLGCLSRTPTSREAEAPAALDDLLRLMRQRLLLMHDVARWKWNARQPIADPARELAFLANIVDQGRRHELEPRLVRTFFAAQIEAAKMIQRDDFERWQAAEQGPFPDAPDLTTTLRPRIDELSVALLAALASLRPFLEKDEVQAAVAEHARELLVGEGITESVRRTAVEPLWPKPGPQATRPRHWTKRKCEGSHQPEA